MVSHQVMCWLVDAPAGISRAAAVTRAHARRDTLSRFRSHVCLIVQVIQYMIMVIVHFEQGE